MAKKFTLARRLHCGTVVTHNVDRVPYGASRSRKAAEDDARRMNEGMCGEPKAWTYIVVEMPKC
jgi:hypothetical protein